MTVNTAGIIVIGDEVLKGQVTDSNVPFLAKKLHALGIKLCKVSIIPDNIDIIAQEVAEYCSKYDQVITTGGIGPTHDDITYEGVGAAFQQPLIINDELVTYWSWFNGDPPGETRRTSTVKMATIPRDAIIHYANLPISLIPDNKFPVITVNNVCILPGLPKYLRAIFNALEGVYFKNSGTKFHVRRIYLNVFESIFASRLNAAVNKYKDVIFGSYPKLNNPYYKTVVTMESQDEKLLAEAYSYFESLLDQSWLAEQGELLGDSWNKTKELMVSDELSTINLSAKLKSSVEILEKCLDQYKLSEIFISFNGGKDCTVLVHLVHSVILKRFNQSELPKLNAVYIRTESPFQEVEDFINVTAQRYNLNLITEEGPLQKGIQNVLKNRKDFKVAILGIRKSDPAGVGLSHIQKTDEGWGNLLRVSPLLEWTYHDIWSYLRELNVPYCPLYDLGILSEDPLKEAIEECEYLCEPLAMAFGPHGLGIMLPDINGLTITKIGSQILNIFDRGESPIRDLLIKAGYDFHLITGDGLKTFFILINSLLKNILKYKQNKIILFKQLKLILNSIDCFNNIEVELDSLDNIISSFFYTRFTSPVAIILSNLYKNWISLNESIENDKFTFLLKNFDALIYHKRNSFPLDESKIIKGVTLSGHYHGIFPKNLEQTLLEVLYFPDDNKDDQTDVNLEIIRILNDLENFKGNMLLVINNEVPDRGKHLLRERRINFLMYAEADTSRLLADYVLIYKSKHRTAPTVEYSCDTLSYMTNITIEIPIYQLQICAPSKSYMKSYSTSFSDCLKLCRFILDTKSPIIPAGVFEKTFALYFASIFGKDNVIPVKAHSELLKWSKTEERLAIHLEKLSIVKEPKNLDDIIGNLMLHIKSINETFDFEAVSVICEALMEIARKIPERNVEIGYECLSIKLVTLQRVLSTALLVTNTDKIIRCKKINSSVESDEATEFNFYDIDSD